MKNKSTQSEPEPTMFKTIRNDIRQGDFRRSVKREFKELKESMLNEQRQKRLTHMSRIQKWFYVPWWLLKSLFLKLTPVRRLLLVIGVLFLSVNINAAAGRVNINFQLLGTLLILFVLMLELKDKLLAQSELEAGRAIQQALMPDRAPNVPGWNLWLFTRSANEVGGDLVDFVQIDNTRFGVALGDIAGKGLSAALVTAKLQATLRALVPYFTSLAELGNKLNHVFCRDCLKNIFASLVYLDCLSDSGVVRILNAGHIPPLLVRGSQIEEMIKGGMALGIAPDASFIEQQVELEKGDFILVYSDGVTEARNENGEFFGDAQLFELILKITNLPTGEMGEQIVAAVERFMGEAKTHDDLSIALLRRA